MNSPKNLKKSVRVSPFDINEAALPEEIIEDAREAVHLAFEREGRGKSFQVSVIITSDREMAALNKKYLDKSQPTDVLSFPYSEGKMVSADVYVSADRARIFAKDYGHTFREELLFIILHGVLHLLGYNDSADGEREKMWRKQEELLGELKR